MAGRRLKAPTPGLAASVVALSLGAELLERTPSDWQREAAQALGQGYPPRMPVALGPLTSWVAEQRAAALASVEAAADLLLIQACQKAQQAQRQTSSAARFYGSIAHNKIVLAVPREMVWLLGLGPKRTAAAAVKAAARRNPEKLWKAKGGWKSLGERPGRGAGLPPAPEPEPEQRRTRSGLGVRRSCSGSGG